MDGKKDNPYTDEQSEALVIHKNLSPEIKKLIAFNRLIELRNKNKKKKRK